jgi:hypothetical protein
MTLMHQHADALEGEAAGLEAQADATNAQRRPASNQALQPASSLPPD